MVPWLAIALAGPSFGTVTLLAVGDAEPIPLADETSMEVGVSPHGGRLAFATPKGPDRVAASIRYTATATLSQEGPTWPLSSLGTGRTEWTPLKGKGSTFELPPSPDKAALPFDDHTPDALPHAMGTTTWTERGQPTCTAVRDYP